jgi:hypothetical protein
MFYKRILRIICIFSGIKQKFGLGYTKKEYFLPLKKQGISKRFWIEYCSILRITCNLHFKELITCALSEIRLFLTDGSDPNIS